MPRLSKEYQSMDIMKKSYFLKRKSLQHTSDMLTTRLPSSITKLKQMNFGPNLTAFIQPSNLPLTKREREMSTVS